MTPTYPDGLLRRLLHPALPRLEACHALVCERIAHARVLLGPDGPALSLPTAFDRHRAAQIWELLAAQRLIPEAWVGSTCFRFAQDVGFAGQPIDRLARWRDLTLTATTPGPPTVRAAVRLAAGAPGAAAAMSLAKELIARYEPWGARGSGRVVWALMPAGQVGRDEERWRYPSAWEIPQWAAWVAVRPFFEGERLRALAGVPRLESAVSFWREACERDLRVPDPVSQSGKPPHLWSDRLAGIPFRALPDPFETWVEILSAGYYLSGLAGDEVVLIGCIPEAPEARRTP
jgi:hypothetical protein